ncbi:thioesterase family protein [Shewanella sp. 10N.261.52.F9]|uniref:thioesterase family protein n=1 Tax=Shewanella sp. 10N.261.52.F9 TaxID=3229684 RepID=UPI00354D6334
MSQTTANKAQLSESKSVQQSKTYHFPVQIYYEDTDFSGVVYHPNFLKYFERAREHVIGANSLASLWDEHDLGFAVYRTDMLCHDGVEFADIIDVRTKFYLESKYRTVWIQEIWRPNGKKPAVTAQIEMVCMNKKRQLSPMPQQLIARLGEAFAEQVTF